MLSHIHRLEVFALGGSIVSLGGIGATLAQGLPAQWHILTTVGVALAGSVVALVSITKVIYSLYRFSRQSLVELISESVGLALASHIEDETEQFAEIRESFGGVHGELRVIRSLLRPAP